MPNNVIPFQPREWEDQDRDKKGWNPEKMRCPKCKQMGLDEDGSGPCFVCDYEDNSPPEAA